MAFPVFFLLSEINTDKESENRMNFLYLHIAIRFNVSSSAQISALKMDASFSVFFMIVLLRIVFSLSLEPSVKIFK